MNIRDYESKVWSQFTGDGVVLELTARTKAPHSFLEIGCGDGSENNSRILAANGWTGVWVDSDAGNCLSAMAVADPLGVRVICSKVSLENVASLATTVAKVIGFLSIDVDGNDYHLWRGLCDGPHRLRPYIVAIEAQIQRPHDEPWIMPYDADYVWPHNNNDCGASVLSMKALGGELGYTCLGLLSNPHDPNIYFCRSDLVERLG